MHIELIERLRFNISITAGNGVKPAHIYDAWLKYQNKQRICLIAAVSINKRRSGKKSWLRRRNCTEVDHTPFLTTTTKKLCHVAALISCRYSLIFIRSSPLFKLCQTVNFSSSLSRVVRPINFKRTSLFSKHSVLCAKNISHNHKLLTKLEVSNCRIFFFSPMADYTLAYPWRNFVAPTSAN